MSVWALPARAVIEGREYGINADFRDILEIFSYFDDQQLPEYFRWRIALALFYTQPVEPGHRKKAMEYLAWFIRGGQQEQMHRGVRLLDWELDGAMIVADVNRVAGQEIRKLSFVHWWTFLAWFHAIGQGQLSTVIAIRDKLSRGRRLEGWELEFYRENRARVDMKKPCTQQQLQEKQRLIRLLDGKDGEKNE